MSTALCEKGQVSKKTKRGAVASAVESMRAIGAWRGKQPRTLLAGQFLACNMFQELLG